MLDIATLNEMNKKQLIELMKGDLPAARGRKIISF